MKNSIEQGVPETTYQKKRKLSFSTNTQSNRRSSFFNRKTNVQSSSFKSFMSTYTMTSSVLFRETWKYSKENSVINLWENTQDKYRCLMIQNSNKIVQFHIDLFFYGSSIFWFHLIRENEQIYLSTWQFNICSKCSHILKALCTSSR